MSKTQVDADKHLKVRSKTQNNEMTINEPLIQILQTPYL